MIKTNYTKLHLFLLQYACAQYIVGYLTKNESGMSKLLKAVNDQAGDISNLELLNRIAGVLDKHREVSIQEAVYRVLSLPMTKSSVIVKYLSTIHPNFRDGLLKGDIENLDDDESVFHMSPHQYYENRPYKCSPETTNCKDYEKEEEYWENLTLSEFWSFYDIVHTAGKKDKGGKTNHIPLLNKKGFLRPRSEDAILRYYLNHNNDEDLARGLLILYYPFRNEMVDIHEQNTEELFKENEEFIQAKRNMFEKHKVLTDMIFSFEKEEKESEELEEEQDPDSDNCFKEDETTTTQDLDDFHKWAKAQANKTLNKHRDLTTLVELKDLRRIIINLNGQQRSLFDDFCERLVLDDEIPIYLYIAGKAGTGKSYLLSLMIEIVKHLKMKSGSEFKKPPSIVMAPTANAAYIIKGKTVESALGMLPRKNNTFKKENRQKVSNFSFLYEDTSIVFCDEISMIGSSKFTRIHFQLQDIKGRNDFMGGMSFIAVGDFQQLPPVKDRYAFEKSNLDGRPSLSPSHWDDNFKIFYLTEKMRSQKDPIFSDICDRVGNGTYNETDLRYLRSRVKNTENENSNRNFKSGKVSIIVTTNKRRQQINEEKLNLLLPNEKLYVSVASDVGTNIENPPELSDNLSVTQTGGLEKKLCLKINAPIVITSNHNKAKFKEDGIVNGAKGYVDSIQESKQRESIEVVWVVFKDESVGRLLRYEYKHLLKKHKPSNESAVPILKQKKSFQIENGEIKYQRTQFPITLAYAITSYKCQGDTLDEVIIDFSHEPGERSNIQWGSFYVALTRVKEGSKVFLKSFDESYITYNKKVEDKIQWMIKNNPYCFKRIYLCEQIYEDESDQLKIGYFNINGLLHGSHAEYLNADKNLLNLDILVASETWLTSETDNKIVLSLLKNWNVVKRLDSTDQKKHMGLLLLSSRNREELKDIVFTLDYVEGYRMTNGVQNLLYQGLVVNTKKYYKKLLFIYIRTTPSQSEVAEIAKQFDDFDCIIGDLNLNPKIKEQKQRLDTLCGKEKVPVLNEFTTINFTQPDHILAEVNLARKAFATSYYNFMSDHKSIVLWICSDKNNFTNQFLQKRNFDLDHHLKRKNKIEESKSKEDIGLEDQCKRSEIYINKNILEENETTNEINYDSLIGDNWLDDTVINKYCKLLADTFKEVFILSSFFLENLRKKGYKGVHRWAKEDIFDKKYVLFPLFENSHWFLACFGTRSNKFEIFDPYIETTDNCEEKYRLKIRNQIYEEKREKLMEIATFVEREFIQKHYIATKSMKQVKTEFSILLPPNIPRQTNLYDCGVFMLCFAKCVCSELQMNFSNSDMQTYRIQILEELKTSRLQIERNKLQNTETLQNDLKILSFANPSGRNLCFSNSVVTALMNIAVLENILQIEKDKENDILKELTKLMKISKYNKASTAKIRSMVKSECFKAGQLTRNFNNNKQHDAGEFLISILEHMFSQVPDYLMEKMFGGLLEETIQCCCCNFEEFSIKTLPVIIPLQIKGKGIESCLKEFVETERIEYSCNACRSKQAKIAKKISLEPALLILQLNRYHFNKEINEIQKIHSPVECPPTLMLATGSVYTLSSIVNHSGEKTHEGHYTVILYDKRENSYVLVDDKEVSYDITITTELQQLPYIVTYVKDS